MNWENGVRAIGELLTDPGHGRRLVQRPGCIVIAQKSDCRYNRTEYSVGRGEWTAISKPGADRRPDRALLLPPCACLISRLPSPAHLQPRRLPFSPSTTPGLYSTPRRRALTLDNPLAVPPSLTLATRRKQVTNAERKGGGLIRSGKNKGGHSSATKRKAPQEQKFRSQFPVLQAPLHTSISSTAHHSWARPTTSSSKSCWAVLFHSLIASVDGGSVAVGGRETVPHSSRQNWPEDPSTVASSYEHLLSFDSRPITSVVDISISGGRIEVLIDCSTNKSLQTVGPLDC